MSKGRQKSSHCLFLQIFPLNTLPPLSTWTTALQHSHKVRAPAYDGHVKVSKDCSRKRQKTAWPSAPATQIQNREKRAHALMLHPPSCSLCQAVTPPWQSPARSSGGRDWIPYHGGVGSHAAEINNFLQTQSSV